ncbi:hypothetical protein KMW28_27040 [Flammeovirga yaeyamensis]|uniref:Uncharacterized protein n=1 Tax=Flammeovirga yaeyamensis TaxID=367791 RepID=A0AAX1NDL7_9BACT|nr:hypothetical protein [Flammeovirga yaeyamensis]MBB3700066.1 hypothetical protein [Flammeovirga yaeyamensis]NMF37499.1 hypothetical protein [Flammeovirga yaeyamensis]QWG04556.1 hypothetical protein KMW28_27040 [Flammeovirga yaeyamensis]
MKLNRVSEGVLVITSSKFNNLKHIQDKLQIAAVTLRHRVKYIRTDYASKVTFKLLEDRKLLDKMVKELVK